MEFHVARALRDELGLSDLLFSYTGNVVFGDVAASRRMALRMTEARGAGAEPVNAGALFAMGLIDELSHAMIARYRKEIDPALLTDALTWFEKQLGEKEVERLLLAFTEQFPNVAVYRGEITAAQWLKGTTEDLPNREAALEELLLLWLANLNPGFKPFRELFEDEGLKKDTAYTSATATLPVYFETRPPIAPEIGTLLDALQAPMLASPDSLTGQLDFIREMWAPMIGEELKQVLLAIDVMREEDIAIWMRFNPPGPDQYRHGAPAWGSQGFVGDEYVGFDDEYVTGPDGVRVRRQYAGDYQAPLNEYEAFSHDSAWMPTVVMMAKSTYVWLEQLSQKYERHIHRLDQIPDEELALLAHRGINALWLIGLWERSVASRTIKRLRGHSDAVASAYSLKDYNVAEDLGGNVGYESLRDRALRHGLRLASDMVPNHMGIDSTWVIEHPEWFVTRDESPFPSYSFNGPDLSADGRVEIKIEDHYFDQTDAAVAFRVKSHRDGSTRYMYHGNDGTTFAWNDTAQLDYSKADVREHVIQTILHVARLFPIIRFDAAMVLAKRHVQRLWFPLAGVGGSIPSRAENAMSDEQFDAIMPNEFWREVVDRVAVEVPDTLLLAEAFWMLEGYFVRTLGMHRVYNSAFMNMLRDEENAKYRSYLKKTIEFDPDILKRYVNFMSNPDERTAIDQFGSGDKCFGVATLMCTLPGLPMFGHGQIEGFTERYGMEYKQAKMKESPNEALVARHQQEIAPLLKNRRLFAESTNFLLYDFWNESGGVNENVFAYSNRLGSERAVILYNNCYDSTSGTIHHSAGSMDKGSGELRSRTLNDGLGLQGDDGLVLAYRDTARDMEYLLRAGSLRNNGLKVPLRGYQYVVLQNWRELRSTAEHPWDRLCDALNGAGVYNLNEALSRLRLQPVRDALCAVLSSANIHALADVAQHAALSAGTATGKQSAKNGVVVKATVASPVVSKGVEQPASPSKPVAEQGALPDGLKRFVEQSETFSWRVREQLGDDEVWPVVAEPGVQPFAEACRALTVAAGRLVALGQSFSTVWPATVCKVLPCGGAVDRPEGVWAPILAWIAVRSLPIDGGHEALFDRLQLRASLAEIFAPMGFEGEDMWRSAARVRLLLAHEKTTPAEALRSPEFWADPDVRWLAGVHEAGGKTYFNREQFEEVVSWLHLPVLLRMAQQPDEAAQVAAIQDFIEKERQMAAESRYELSTFLEPEPLKLQTPNFRGVTSKAEPEKADTKR